jgi:hypothetical protein
MSTPEAVETGRGSRFGMPELESAKREGLHDKQRRALFWGPAETTHSRKPHPVTHQQQIYTTDSKTFHLTSGERNFIPTSSLESVWCSKGQHSQASLRHHGPHWAGERGSAKTSWPLTNQAAAKAITINDSGQ